MSHLMLVISTYDHRLKNNRHPVRSAKDKLQIGQLVVGSVTTSEYWLLYVFELLHLEIWDDRHSSIFGCF